ncbi:hypothetical protein Verru16b_00065 [Lacunisphaera limnophila]|uniref:DUF885 domain-containing protein n=1 Tax=Lacunisphaera limnophila TaxID=1838286 RepID=A0A1I7PHE8_9BACT|nr:hypothetical protein [Lacunisphaera limnophila]AOS43027.1 hypothetical protein Verru16b_00065 [Lacunisphaera limnophila]
MRLTGPLLLSLVMLTTASAAPTMNSVAEAYVKLALAAGVHDGDYVDAYYGPPEWKTAAEAAKLPLAEVRRQLADLSAEFARIDPAGADTMGRMRHAYLGKQLQALTARLGLIAGEKLAFDEETRLIYDAVAPTHPASHYDAVLAELDGKLPGTGTVAERYQAFRNQFIIPPAKLDAVFQAAIAAARERTLKRIPLPAGEKFTLEYVTGKPWSGYNWYQGNAHSLIQINTELPIFIDRAVDLAAHEGYPGHHVYSTLLEEKLLRGRGWVEFSVNPLYGPNALIAEGSANYGIDVAFPGAERLAFERDVLFPLAGLDPARVEEFYRVLALTKELSFAGNEAARLYLDGKITAEAAAAWLEKYTLAEPARALQRIKFIEKYRSYVINYNYGLKLVADHVEAKSGGDPARRWAEFVELISSPSLPSQLK